MVFTSITTSTTHQGHQKQLQNLTFLLPATSLPPLRKNGSNIGEDLPDILHIYDIYKIHVYSLSWQGLWVAFSSRLYSCLRRYISKGENYWYWYSLNFEALSFCRVLCSSNSWENKLQFQGDSVRWAHISHLPFFEQPRGLEILHFKVRKFATKVVSRQNTV